MKTLFVLRSGQCFGDEIMAAFTDEQTAIAWRDAIQKEAIQSDEYAFYEDVRLDTLTLVEGEVPHKTTGYFKVAELGDDGMVSGVRMIPRRDWAICHRVPQRTKVRYVRAPCHQDKGGRLEVEAASMESVERIFSKKLRQWMAGKWGGRGHEEIIEYLEE